MNFIQAAAEPNQSLVILITGLVVVFLALILLILVIKVYGTIVSFFQNKSKSKKSKNITESVEPKTIGVINTTPAPVKAKGEDLQTIAVISAAVDSFYGENKVNIVSVKRSCDGAALPWYRAGVMQNISSRRGF